MRITAAIALLKRSFSPETAGGIPRLAAFGFFVLALAGAVVAIIAPGFVHWAGVVLLASVCATALVLFFAMLPRPLEGVEEARRAASAAAASNIAWAVTSREGTVLDCNTAYRFLAGIGEGEPPAPPELAFPGELPAAALYRLARAAIDGRAGEEHFDTESGLRLSASVRPLKRGEAAWWFTPRLPEAAPPKAMAKGAVKDVATEKRLPSALIRFTDFFRNAPVGVAILSGGGNIVEANKPFVVFFSLGTEVAGVQFGDLVAEDEKAPALARIAAAASGKVDHLRLEIHPTSAASSSAQLFVSPFMANADGEAQTILYLVDTSERKALETQFAQSQKMQAIGQLAGGVAHDFNNILQAVIGNCDLLLMRHLAGDPSFAEINEIRQNSVRAAGLVRQLLAFSRQQTLQPKVLSLADTLTELSMLLRRLLGERVRLEIEQAQDLWPVRVDEGQISNAIVNLAVNARDAMLPEGGTISLRTSNVTLAEAKPIGSATMPAGDYVLIEIADTGTGIASRDLPKIFEPFFTTKPVGQGTGLGLATVYGIIKQTGGFITVESETGKGTHFFIYLPPHLAAEEAAPEPTSKNEPTAPRDVTGQDTILLVEDEDAVRNFAARALSMRGYTVIEADSGEAGLEIVRDHDGVIDLLLTDVVMPNMDGPALVRAAHRLRPEMRVIFMSGYAEGAFRRSDEKAEELHFLPKPFGLKQLVAKVKEVLSQNVDEKGPG